MRVGKSLSLAVVLLLAGCVQYVVQPPAPSIAGAPQELHVRSYLGGTIQQPPVVLAEACVDGEQLARVQFRQSFGQGLVGWITLGAVTSATIVYECANVARPGGGVLDEDWPAVDEP
jgi:hypothetical protein